MDEKSLAEYFGKDYLEYLANGIVKWKFIEDKLFRDIDLPPDDSQLKKIILISLR